MYKKSLMVALIFVLALGFINLSNILAASSTDTLENAGNQIQTGVDKAENLGNKANSGWSYLSGEWKKVLLENEFVSAINVVLTSLSFVFLILLGVPYSFSLIFLFAVIFWFFFFYLLRKMFGIFSPFSSGVSLIVASCLTIALAQFGLYKTIASFFVWLIFLPGNPLIGVLIFVGIIVGMILVSKVLKSVYFRSEKNKEKFAKETEKTDRGILHSFVETLKKAWK